jgi:predicted HTH domain antitoxin
MTKAQKNLSIRVDADDYTFLSCLTETENVNVSETVRDLLKKGRLMLAMEQYRAGKASLGRAAELAGMSISETIDLFVTYGIPVNLDVDDYRQSLEHAPKAW